MKAISPTQLARPALDGAKVTEAKCVFQSRRFKLVKASCLLLLMVVNSLEIVGAVSELAAVQESLKSQGFYAGPINGVNDNETAAAVTRFQIQRGLEVTGELNEETLRALQVNVPEARRTGAQEPARPRAEPWRALREQDRKFLEQLSSGEAPVSEQQVAKPNSTDQIRDFVAGFVVVGISADVEEELQFYAEQADYYDHGVVSRDFIRRDILRYNQKWPVRRYWLVGEVQILKEGEPVEVQYQIKYFVQNQQRESAGTAVKTLQLRKGAAGFEITTVREKVLD